jgi:hypothetical protein
VQQRNMHKPREKHAHCVHFLLVKLRFGSEAVQGSPPLPRASHGFLGIKDTLFVFGGMYFDWFWDKGARIYAAETCPCMHFCVYQL